MDSGNGGFHNWFSACLGLYAHNTNTVILCYLSLDISWNQSDPLGKPGQFEINWKQLQGTFCLFLFAVNNPREWKCFKINKIKINNTPWNLHLLHCEEQTHWFTAHYYLLDTPAYLHICQCNDSLPSIEVHLLVIIIMSSPRWILYLPPCFMFSVNMDDVW